MRRKEQKIIYLHLMGRIGNQLFEYAFAYSLQQEYGNALIVVDESEVIKDDWKDSLRDYNLIDVEYVNSVGKSFPSFQMKKRIFKLYQKFIYNTNPVVQLSKEKKYQRLLNKLGLIAIEKGYAHYQLNRSADVYVYGYYQSERYFEKYKNDIKRLFDLTEQLYLKDYPNIRKIEERNTVCLSIKIEGNYYSPDYNICDANYYRKAVEYMVNNLENPLFFVCSDDLKKAKELFLKDFDIEMIYQPKEYEVPLSLCAMSKCKHFIINNTSFGWWAQYLSNNEDKIVIAPSKWMNNDDPVSVYDGQHFTYV